MSEILPAQREAYEKLIAYAAEVKARRCKTEQSRVGWYDDDGVRQGGLMAFVRYFWEVVEPERKMVDGWPLWAMCEHLEAVTEGKVGRLLINVPPGFMKSLLCNVFWPAWEWGPMGKPHYRYIAFSYSAHLTERDNLRFRTLIASPKYQQLYGPVVTTEERGEELSFEKTPEGVTLANKTTIKVMNSKTGWKLASSVGGVGTGERGDRVIIDDPHNVVESESDIVRAEAARWFRESISSRFNDLASGALVIIMQRVHYDDLSAVALGLDVDYTHLLIPWEFDPRVAYSDGHVRVNQIGWYDPRADEEDPDANVGEPAWPERFPQAEMDRQRQEVGPYGWSGQFQQQPTPRGEGIFLREWWQEWDSVDRMFPVCSRVIASVDGAFTDKERNNPSALTVWGVWQPMVPQMDGKTGATWEEPGGNTRIMLLHAWRKHLKFSGPRIERGPDETADQYKFRTQKEWGLIEWIVETCDRFKVDTLLIEGKGPGLSAAQELQSRFGTKPWGVHICKVKGDKVARALAAQPTFSQRLVYHPYRDWAEMVIEEMEQFPLGKYDDLTDSATQAINFLRAGGSALTDDEVRYAEGERSKWRKKPGPLYPV